MKLPTRLRDWAKLGGVLPKQWLHWAQLARLRPERRRGKLRSHYLVGRGRRWRVNCLGEFECSCPNRFFDRWANSRGASVAVPPSSEAEFLTTVTLLVERSKSAR